MWLNVAGGKNESKHSTLFCGLIRTSQLPTVKMLHPLVRDVGGGVSDQRRPDLPKYSADAVEAAESIKTPFSSALLELLSSASAASSKHLLFRHHLILLCYSTVCIVVFRILL